MTGPSHTVSPERRAQIVPPAQHQTSLPPGDLLHSANAGVVVERVGQVRSEFRNEARMFVRELCEHVNTKQVGVATAFVYEETFGVEDRLHILIHLKSLDSYYPMIEMGDRDQKLCADERTRESRVDIADDNRPRRPGSDTYLLVLDHYASRLRAVAAAPGTEMHVRIRQAQIREERVGHVRVVVLAGVDDSRDTPGFRCQRVIQRRDLHEVRAGCGYEIDRQWSCH